MRFLILLTCSCHDLQRVLALGAADQELLAILRHEIHPFVTVGEIREGSYVHVTKYELAQAKRTNGNGMVL